MSDSQIKTTLANILTIINTNKTVLDDVKIDNALIMEILNNINQRVEDISKKYDYVLNAGIKKPKQTTSKKEPAQVETPEEPTPTPKKKVASKAKPKAKTDETDGNSKVIKNIMTYTKELYLQNPTAFEELMEKGQLVEIFEKNIDEINAKKEGDCRNKFKAILAYKGLNDEQRKKVRTRMLAENDAASVNNDEDVVEDSVSD
jgi:hypothetical protein